MVAQMERGCSTDEARMVAQLGRGWWHSWGADGGTDGARLERGWSAEGAQTECCWWRSRSEVSSVDGAQLVAQTERG